jgi:hypothetical protein
VDGLWLCPGRVAAFGGEPWRFSFTPQHQAIPRRITRCCASATGMSTSLQMPFLRELISISRHVDDKRMMIHARGSARAGRPRQPRGNQHHHVWLCASGAAAEGKRGRSRQRKGAGNP